MILQKFVSPCYSRTTHKHYRPGNRENQPTRNFTINDFTKKSLQYVKKNITRENLFTQKLISRKLISAKINLHVRN